MKKKELGTARASNPGRFTLTGEAFNRHLFVVRQCFGLGCHCFNRGGRNDTGPRGQVRDKRSLEVEAQSVSVKGHLRRMQNRNQLESAGQV